MKQVIVFDGQVFQTGAWDRGMGKYSRSLIGAIIEEASDDTEFYIVFTTQLQLSEVAKVELEKFTPRIQTVYLDLKIPRSADVTDYLIDRAANTALLDEFIAMISDNPMDVKYVILALFIDSLCVTYPRLTENVLLFYDLIPLLYHRHYSMFPTYNLYLSQFRPLIDADKIMTISQTVADDLAGFLGIPSERLCNIDGGPIKRIHISAKRPTSFDIPDNFLLMPTGNDMRKNNLRAVQGFEEYRISNLNSDTYLIITSFFDDVTKQELLSYSDHLIFTGNITEAELLWLYQHMRTLLFIPESEGLGLPILEAIEVGKPIVCSRIGPFYEMSDKAFYFANHFSSAAIAETIASAMSGYEWNKKKEYYTSIVNKYQWDRTGRKAHNFLMHSDKHVSKLEKKPRLAIVGPDPKGYSAIGKVIEQTHPVLERYFDIDYFIEKQKQGTTVLRPSYIEYMASARLVEALDLELYRQYDSVIYHIGNSEYHTETIKKALSFPGYVVIHDTQLDNIFGYMKSHGIISENRYDAETKLDKLFHVKESSKLVSLLSNQYGAMVHSDFAKQAIDNIKLPHLPVTKAILPASVPEQRIPKLSSRKTIGLAGIIHPVKGLDLIKALAGDPDFSNVRFEIFGMAMADQETIETLSSIPNISVSTNLTDYEFQLKLAQLDILVSYRADYHGETSLSVIEGMRTGVVPIVRNVGWFSELPSDAALKIKSTKELVGAIARLLDNPDELAERSERSVQYVRDNLTYEQYAQDIKSLIGTGGKRAASLASRISRNLKKGDIQEALNLIKEGH